MIRQVGACSQPFGDRGEQIVSNHGDVALGVGRDTRSTHHKRYPDSSFPNMGFAFGQGNIVRDGPFADFSAIV